MRKAGSVDKFPAKLFVLIALLVQALLLFHLNLYNVDSNNNDTSSLQSLKQEIASYEVKSAHDKDVIRNLEKTINSLRFNQSRQQNLMQAPSPPSKQEKATPPPEGVALLLMTDQPKWFQRRYSLLIHNLLSNLPSTWTVQIFYPDSKQFHAGVELNPGFKRLITNNHPRLHLTKLPPKLVKARKRPIHLMLHPFIWENTLADQVLYLDGNHVLCANSPFSIQDFLRYDYIGAPGWGMFKGTRHRCC
jgi:hypothetical protein